MKKATIRATEYYLPPRRLTNEDLHRQFPEWSVEKISGKTGIRERRIADPEVCSSDLAVDAAKKLFASGVITPDKIDFVLLCTQSPDYLLPTTACLIQDRLRIPQTAGALDFNLGCSGFVYGLSLAKGLIETDQARNVLLLTAETYSKFIREDDKSVRTLFGDGAAATLVSATPETGPAIGPFVFGTDGSGGKNLIVESGGLRHPGVPEMKMRDLYMHGPEIFRFTIGRIPGLVNDILDKSGWTMNEVDLFIFHQANQYMLRAIRDRLGLPHEKFYEYIETVGNTVSSTIPIALHHAIAEGRARKGGKLVFVGFGVGYSWAACAVRL